MIKILTKNKLKSFAIISTTTKNINSNITTATTSTSILFNNINKNKINNNNNTNTNKIPPIGNRTFFTINPQFHNKSHDILQSLSTPSSLKDTYKILSDISVGSYYKTANIRISFFNNDKEKCDIKGVRLFCGKKKDGLIVIIGARDPSQWTNISLSLYLAALLSQKPLDNFDVVIFPVENPIPITSSNDQLQQAQQQPSMMIGKQQSSINNLNNYFSSQQQQQPPLFDNYPKGKSNNALNDWLKKTKKDFIPLKINSNNTISPSTTTKPNSNYSSSFNSFDLFNSNSVNQHQQQLLPNSILFNNQFSGSADYINDSNHLSNFQFTTNEKSNYILDTKNLKFHPNFNTEQLQSFGLNLTKQLENLDNMYNFKKMSINQEF